MLLPTVAKMRMYMRIGLDYGGHSETEPVLVCDDELAILSASKIQSNLLGNLEDIHREMK